VAKVVLGRSGKTLGKLAWELAYRERLRGISLLLWISRLAPVAEGLARAVCRCRAWHCIVRVAVGGSRRRYLDMPCPGAAGRHG
jgi:hypothetical protein